MTPETEQKLNGFVDSWNYTNRLIGAALALCVCGPFILFFVLGLIAGIFAVFMDGDFRLFCIFFPVSLILVLAMILDDGTPLIKRTRQQPSPKLSKWEEKKKAESLYKFP